VQFLTNFKTTAEQTITHALGNITINEDDISDDEYDFMDEDGNAQQQRQRQQKATRKGPYFKYKEMMQELADRKIDEVTIDLDDIVTVSILSRLLLWAEPTLLTGVFFS
jgi:DNA replication licensing factor MCM7